MDPYLFRLDEISLARPANRELVAAFLAGSGLAYAPGLERYYGVFSGEVLVGGIGRQGRVLKCAAVGDAYRGEGILGALVSRALSDCHRDGVANVFVFTKPENQVFFADLGFALVGETAEVVLMESDRTAFRRYSEALRKLLGEGPPPEQNDLLGAAVMNCNPFTLGHRYLLEQARCRCDRLLVLVVEEDLSVFPFADRIRLVREGVADLPGVAVVPGGPYVVSAATFPTYFLKELSRAAEIHAELDATIFGSAIAPALGIKRRFVGEEPFDPLTAAYNAALLRILPPKGVEVQVIPRLAKDGVAVSASRVRKLLASGEWTELARLVPGTTLAYLQH